MLSNMCKEYRSFLNQVVFIKSRIQNTLEFKDYRMQCLAPHRLVLKKKVNHFKADRKTLRIILLVAD